MRERPKSTQKKIRHKNSTEPNTSTHYFCLMASHSCWMVPGARHGDVRHWSSIAALMEYMGGKLDLGLLSLQVGFSWHKNTPFTGPSSERWRLCAWTLMRFLGVEQAAAGCRLMASGRNMEKTHFSWEKTSKKEKWLSFQERKLPKKERKPHRYLVSLGTICGMLQRE